MTRQSIFRRFVIPLILVVGVWAVSSAVYNNAWRLDHGILRTLAVGIFGPLLFLSIWFFAFVGPPIAYFRGASFIERFIIAFVNPVCWVVRVEAQVACQYDFVELIYFFFLPWTFGVICVTLLEFSLADIGLPGGRPLEAAEQPVHSARRRPGPAGAGCGGHVFRIDQGAGMGLFRGSQLCSRFSPVE